MTKTLLSPPSCHSGLRSGICYDIKQIVTKRTNEPVASNFKQILNRLKITFALLKGFFKPFRMTCFSGKLTALFYNLNNITKLSAE